MSDGEYSLTRRTVLRGTASGAVAGAALGSVGSVSAQSTGLDSWFSDTSNYDGVVDKTGQAEVTVTVGASGDQGNFAFGPAAVRVDPGTTVVWEWNGKGGSHNVVEESGSFESEMVHEAGHTFSHTFENEGTFRYVCVPHETLGMKGAVLVGDTDGSGGGSTSDDSSQSPSPSDELWMLSVGGGVLLAAISPVLFGIFSWMAGTDDGPGRE